ncbi:hypothetical protein DPQ22_06205 [Candidatus Tokpelaia sp.]|nr:hypothetical protein DPQ22_06205 [Candidatus Tokpelaia sp.]
MIFYQYAVRKTRRIIEQHNNALQPDRILRVYARPSGLHGLCAPVLCRAQSPPTRALFAQLMRALSVTDGLY